MDSRTSVQFVRWAKPAGPTETVFFDRFPTEVNLKKVKKSLMVGLPQTDFAHSQFIQWLWIYIYIFGCKLIQKKIGDFVELSTVLSW